MSPSEQPGEFWAHRELTIPGYKHKPMRLMLMTATSPLNLHFPKHLCSTALPVLPEALRSDLLHSFSGEETDSGWNGNLSEVSPKVKAELGPGLTFHLLAKGKNYLFY